MCTASGAVVKILWRCHGQGRPPPPRPGPPSAPGALGPLRVRSTSAGPNCRRTPLTSTSSAVLRNAHAMTVRPGMLRAMTSTGKPVPGWPDAFRGTRAVAAGLVTRDQLRGPRYLRIFPRHVHPDARQAARPGSALPRRVPVRAGPWRAVGVLGRRTARRVLRAPGRPGRGDRARKRSTGASGPARPSGPAGPRRDHAGQGRGGHHTAAHRLRPGPPRRARRLPLWPSMPCATWRGSTRTCC